MCKDAKELIEKGKSLLSELEKFVESSKLESERFKKLADGWVLDKATLKEWGPSSAKEMNFEDAEKYCTDKSGRLPTLRELQSIVDYERHEPAIDTAFFPDTKSSWYWTSTETNWNKSSAWCVVFFSGGVGYGNKGNANYVRPVRASQCG